jgi:WD40 repeat protein
MGPDPPANFIPRPELLDALKHALVDDRGDPLPTRVSLVGAGGFGKTTLAAVISRDPDVVNAFSDGIVWVTLGQHPDLLSGLASLYSSLTGERPGFSTLDEAASGFAGVLQSRECLLIIDDVWNDAHLRPFLQGGPNTARLITTRRFDVANTGAWINVDQMNASEARHLLVAGLEDQDTVAVHDLGLRLGRWPLLLALARGMVKRRMARGESMALALTYVGTALERRGVTAFDQADALLRDQAVRLTIEASLEYVTDENRERLVALAVFPESTPLPIAPIGMLWGLNDFECSELIESFDNLALLRFDAARGSIELHDMMHKYFAEQAHDLTDLHRRLLEAWGDPHSLADPYAWRWIGYHLVNAGQESALQGLLREFDWLQAKLQATDIQSLLADFNRSGQTEERQIVGALEMSAHILARDPGQLPNQLLGRLEGPTTSAARQLLDGARRWAGKRWLRPTASRLVAPTGPLRRSLGGHTQTVSALAYLPDDRHALSGSWDCTIKLWDTASGSEIRTMEGHTHWVLGLAVIDDGTIAVSASADQSLKVWNIDSGRQIRTLDGHSAYVTSVAVTPDGRYAFSGSNDGTACLWDLPNGTEVARIRVTNSDVQWVGLTPDGIRGVTVSSYNEVQVWDLRRRTELRRLQGHNYRGNMGGISSDGRYVAAMATRMLVGWSLNIWDIDSDSEPWQLEGDGELESVAFSRDGRRMVLATRPAGLQIWSLKDRMHMATIPVPVSVRQVALTRNGQRAISGSYGDDLIRVWDLTYSAEELPLVDHTGVVNAVALTVDARTAVSASADGTLIVWDVASGSRLRTLRGHTWEVSAVAITPDSRYVISGSSDHTARVWDLESAAMLRMLKRPRSSIYSLAVTPDGHRVVAGCDDWTLKIWDIETGLRRSTMKVGALRAIRLSADGKRAVIALQDHALSIWDVDAAIEILRLADTAYVLTIAITADGSRAVTGCLNGEIELWDLRSGKRSGLLRGHDPLNGVYAIAMTPDGRRMVSASADHTIRLWDMVTQDTLATFTADSGFYACDLSADGQTVVAGDGDGKVHFLRLVGDS